MLWPAHAGGDADGAQWACGGGDSGQLGLNVNENRHVFEQVGAGAFGARVVSAAARDVHSAALTEDGALWTWGGGGFGQLGHDDRKRRLVPTEVAKAGLRGGPIGGSGGYNTERVSDV